MSEAARTRTPDIELFRDVFKASPIGIGVATLEGQPLFVNPAFCSMLGFSEEELRNKHCADFSLPEDAQKDWALFEQLKAGSIDHYQLERRYFRKDGSLVRGRLSMSLLKSYSSPLVIAMVEDITYHKQAEELRSGMSRKLIEAQERERSRIGRELHDDIVQRLSMASAELQQLHDDPFILPEVRSRVSKLQKQTSEIASDIQSLSHELHSAKLQYLGIAAAMKGFCREFGEQQNVEIDFQARDLPSPVSPDIALCLFRVLQEALHNSAKHSGVRHFEVRFWRTSDEIHLTVADSGAGFDREAAMKSTGLGLMSMQERLRSVGGALSIESQPRRGTTIHARVPFTSSRDSALAAGQE